MREVCLGVGEVGDLIGVVGVGVVVVLVLVVDVRTTDGVVLIG